MTFYNPNIQAAFEDDNRESILLRDVELAKYEMIYRISDGCSIRCKDDLRAVYQLEFVKFADAVQQENLRFVDDDFAALLADIALEVLVGRVSSFEAYLYLKLAQEAEIKRNEVLNAGDSIQNFIELLIFSAISNKKSCTGERDFTRILGEIDVAGGNPVFYSLFDRLKLYARLRKEIVLEVDREAVLIDGREVRLELTIGVRT